MNIMTLLEEMREVTIQKQIILNQYRNNIQKNNLTNALLHSQLQPNVHQNFNKPMQNNKLSDHEKTEEALASAAQILRNNENALRLKRDQLIGKRIHIFLKNKSLHKQILEQENQSINLFDSRRKTDRKSSRTTNAQQKQNYEIPENIQHQLTQKQKENQEKQQLLRDMEEKIQRQKKQTKKMYEAYEKLEDGIEDKTKYVRKLKKQMEALDQKMIKSNQRRKQLQLKEEKIWRKSQECRNWEIKIGKMEKVRKVLVQNCEKWISNRQILAPSFKEEEENNN